MSQHPSDPNAQSPDASWTDRVIGWGKAQWQYCMTGVWQDPRRSWRVTTIKTLHLAVRSFMDSDLQVRAASLTYNTVLAIVPVLAMIFAIGRGFGFQNLLQDQLYTWFPSQHQVMSTALRFVDGYLAQASEGLFVGVGLVFLLWTMISLLGNVEDAFNTIWDVKHGRTIWRKIPDYLAIFLVLPILMICGGGLSIFMSTTLHNILPFSFMSPAIGLLLDFASLAFTWLFFAAAYMLIPNAKVKPLNALLAGIVAGTSFQILQWLFLSGQLYVAKYNAIYGSFSFLPLFLLWLYLTWLITLIGAVLCYASQNIFALSFIGQTDSISTGYRRKVTLAIMTIICRRFYDRKPPLTLTGIARIYDLPPRLIKDVTDTLVNVGLLCRIALNDKDAESPLQPAVPVESLRLSAVISKTDSYGASDFIPLFDSRFKAIIGISRQIDTIIASSPSDMLLIDIPVGDSPSDPAATPQS